MIEKKLFNKFKGDMRIFNTGQILPKKLTERIVVVITPQMRDSIAELIEKGIFPNKSEFIRYLIRKYLDEIIIHEWRD